MRNAKHTSARQYELAARRGLILEAVKVHKSMTFKEICGLFPPKSVSAPTIRTDINAIVDLLPVVKNERGGLQVRGEPKFKDTYFGNNLNVKKEEKGQIARYLIDAEIETDESPYYEFVPYADHLLINRNGDAVVVGPGTSTLAVLRILAERPGVETLTTNVGILDEVPDFITKPFLHLSGGWVLSGVGSLVGIMAVRNINACGAKTAIIGVSGFCTDEHGEDICLYCHQEAQLRVKEALVENREKVIVVTCGEKIGVRDTNEFSHATSILQYADLYVFTDRISDEKGKEVVSCMKRLNRSPKAKGHEARVIELPAKNSGQTVEAPASEGGNL